MLDILINIDFFELAFIFIKILGAVAFAIFGFVFILAMLGLFSEEEHSDNDDDTW